MMKGTGIWSHDNTTPIKYDMLLNRFFTLLHSQHPDLAGNSVKSYKIPPPQCLREGNKKTIFANIAEICKRMKRTDEHVTQFLFAELGTSGSVDGSRRLVIKGRFQQKQIENVLRRYIVEYVTCKTCRSPDTEYVDRALSLFFPAMLINAIVSPRVRTVSASSLATAAAPGARYRPLRPVSLRRSEREGGWSRLNEFTFALYGYRHTFAWLDWRALRMLWRFTRSDNDIAMREVYARLGVQDYLRMAYVYLHCNTIKSSPIWCFLHIPASHSVLLIHLTCARMTHPDVWQW